MGEINDSLCNAVDRYTLTRSVPELYNSVGRGGIAALKHEADLERHETWPWIRQGTIKLQPTLPAKRRRKKTIGTRPL